MFACVKDVVLRQAVLYAAVALTNLVVSQCSTPLSGRRGKIPQKVLRNALRSASRHKPDNESLFPVRGQGRLVAHFWDQRGQYVAFCLCDEAKRERLCLQPNHHLNRPPMLIPDAAKVTLICRRFCLRCSFLWSSLSPFLFRCAYKRKGGRAATLAIYTGLLYLRHVCNGA